MLLTKEIQIEMNGKKIKFYKELGYEIPTKIDKEGIYRVKKGTSVPINIEDVPLGSHVFVDVRCDYCKNIFKVRYDAYNKQRAKYNIDACGDCKINKIKHANMEKYGVENCGELDFVKNKIALSLNSKEVRTSKQQRYIKSIIDEDYNAVINYNDGNTTYNFNLDIAIPNIKIYIEYDGSGHDLCIKFNNKTEENFYKGEIRRFNMLKKNGWKMIKIISKYDKLPNSTEIKRMISNGINTLDNNFYVIYNIDENYIKSDEAKMPYDFKEIKVFR